MTHWTWAGAHLPDLEGQGVYFATPADREPIIDKLRADGYRVVEVDGAALTDAKAARAAIAKALGLQESAANNADAFADSLADLTCPAGRLMLLWGNAATLLEHDLAGWTEIVGDLKSASAYHWDPENDDAPTNLVFETILLVDGDGVRQLS